MPPLYLVFCNEVKQFYSLSRLHAAKAVIKRAGFESMLHIGIYGKAKDG